MRLKIELLLLLLLVLAFMVPQVAGAQERNTESFRVTAGELEGRPFTSLRVMALSGASSTRLHSGSGFAAS